MAESCLQAIKKERTAEVDDCWVDDDWKKDNPVCSAIGFEIENDDEY